MDEKTSELRDIFLDVADEETVTESQEQSRGSVTDSGKPDVKRLRETLSEMRAKFAFETELDDDGLEALLEAYYGGLDDDEIGAELSVSTEAVFEARMELHLVRDEDPPGVTADEAAWKTVRTRTEADAETLAAELEMEIAAVERLQEVAKANARSRRVSNRFRTTFEECLTDADLSTQLAAETHRDGLDDATADAEVDVDF